MSPARKMITAAVQDNVIDESRPDETPAQEPDFVDVGPGLDDDEDTSLAKSLVLHMVSEHGMASALHMNDVEAERRHDELHQAAAAHDELDFRFRPARVLAALALAAQKHEDVQRLVAPLQPLRP